MLSEYSTMPSEFSIMNSEYCTNDKCHHSSPFIEKVTSRNYLLYETDFEENFVRQNFIKEKSPKH